jgi:hypothetical protein
MLGTLHDQITSFISIKNAVCFVGVPVGIGIFWCIEKLLDLGKAKHNDSSPTAGDNTGPPN